MRKEGRKEERLCGSVAESFWSKLADSRDLRKIRLVSHRMNLRARPILVGRKLFSVARSCVWKRPPPMSSSHLMQRSSAS